MSFLSDIGSAVGMNFDVGAIIDEGSDVLGGEDILSAVGGDYVDNAIGGTTSLLDDFGVDVADILGDGTGTTGTVDRIHGTGGTTTTGTDIHRGGGMNRGVWLPQGGDFIRTGGMAGGVVALGAYLARRWGTAGVASAAVKLGNKYFKLGQLWPLVNKYGASAVAGALGIGLGALGRLLIEAPKHTRRRRRGLTWRQLANAKRTVRVLRSMDHSFARAAGHRRSSSRRGSGANTIIANRA